jgi:hypothetical protein
LEHHKREGMNQERGREEEQEANKTKPKPNAIYKSQRW